MKSSFNSIVVLVLAVGFFTLGCNENFDPPSKVTGFRLLAIKAAHPEIASMSASNDNVTNPPHWTELNSLVADPEYFDNPSKQSTVVYFACTPDPRYPSGSGCTTFEALRNPEALVSGVTGEAAQCVNGQEENNSSFSAMGVGVVGGISLAGVEACDASGCHPVSIPVGENSSVTLPAPRYVLPGELDLNALPEESPARSLGVQVVIIAFAIDAPPEELLVENDPCLAAVRIPERLGELTRTKTTVNAIKRIVVRGPDVIDEPNVNPQLRLMAADETALPTAISVNSELEMQAFPVSQVDGQQIDPNSLYQSYTTYDYTGTPQETAKEEWGYTWFATSKGKLAKELTLSDPSRANKLQATEKGPIWVWVVARDSRGGVNWTKLEVSVTP